ncbi:MAG: hypothetical protein CEE38_19725 [Planctomycetes bacterium B3_Pla]|nr:MAG: hypothetical protein CEE38_19725 [Planctomycetes bacterium B3_Pla]
MKAFVRTIIVFVAFNLITAGFALAQDASNEEALTAQRQAEVARREAELAAKAAQKEAEIAQKQMEAAQKQVEASLKQVAVAKQSIPTPPTQPSMPPAPAMPLLAPLETRLSSLSRSLSSLSRSDSAGAVLVIPSEQIKTEDLVAVTEDMSVMSAIFQKNLQQANIAPSGGSLFVSSRDRGPYAWLSGGSRGAIQSMCLQGYGVLFLMNVDFPLSPPPQAEQEEQAEEKEDTDPVWDQVKRDMYEPQAARRRKADRPAEEYDAEKVENLKTTVINALKHAANIRSLKPDESVVVTIAGSGGSVGNITSAIVTTGQVVIHDKDRRTMRIVDAPQPADLGLSTPMVMIIRAKKSDIDGLAKGELDLSQFRQRVQMLSYPLLGGATGSGDALNFYHRYKSTPSTGLR